MLSPPRLSPGARIGPYEILGLLGAGGMGEVYKARDTRLDRTVAIKVLPAYSAGDAEAGKRLLREARAASALNHPHIVTIHDVLSDGGRDSLVMEYVEGRTLEQVIGQKALPLAEVLQYGIQIAGALAAAHAAGIVHRDLKPGNIMIAKTGVKVLDFGLAKLQSVAPEGETASMTAEGVIAGTVAYMSPEQAEGRDVDARSDIFAFGSVLYEMAAGHPAFSGTSKLAILTSILHETPPPLPGAPPELDRLLQRCLRKDPVRRLHSMHDVRVLLEELRDSPPSPLMCINGGGAGGLR
jgi:serine/threonine protein kinase